jgi:tetratricopeptide (TPR) repeat protein
MALLWLLSAAAAVVGSVALLQISQQLQAGDTSLTLPLNSLLFAVTPDVILRTVSVAGLTLGGVALLGLLMALGLLARWRAVYVLHTLLVLLVLVGAVALVGYALPALDELFRQDPTSATAVVAGLIGLPLVQLLLALMARRDFFPRRERVRLAAVARTPEEHWKLGSSYQQRGWRWAAAGEYERAAELEPQSLRYRRALADIYTSMGDHARAREELRASLNLQPHTSPASRAGPIAEEVQRERQ